MKHIGDRGEKIVSDLLTKYCVAVKKNEDKLLRYDYDLLCQIKELNFTCEVKFDLMAEKTGNLAIETHNTKADKPSGINVTKADLWVIVLSNNEEYEVFSSSVRKLKDWLNNNKPNKKVKFGGDKNAELFLYKKEDILVGAFTKIDDIDPKRFYKWLIQEIK